METQLYAQPCFLAAREDGQEPSESDPPPHEVSEPSWWTAVKALSFETISTTLRATHARTHES